MVDIYFGMVSPVAFGSGTSFTADVGSGDRFGVGGNFLLVPSDYVAGSMLDASNTYTGATFASLGVPPGIYTWSWGSGPNSDFFTLNIVGSPSVPDSGSTAASMLLGLGALALLARVGHRAFPAQG